MSIKGFGRECVNYFKGKKFFLCQQKQREWANFNVNKGLGKYFHPRDMWKCPKKRCINSKNPQYKGGVQEKIQYCKKKKKKKKVHK